MDLKQAYEIITRVCTSISATRQDHAIIDEALKTLKPVETTLDVKLTTEK